MSRNAKLDEHEELVRRMADMLGLDLETEMQAGRLTPEQFDDTVKHCVGCLEAGECQKLLNNSEQGDDAGAPDYCRNKSLFDAIRLR